MNKIKISLAVIALVVSLATVAKTDPPPCTQAQAENLCPVLDDVDCCKATEVIELNGATYQIDEIVQGRQ